MDRPKPISPEQQEKIDEDRRRMPPPPFPLKKFKRPNSFDDNRPSAPKRQVDFASQPDRDHLPRARHESAESTFLSQPAERSDGYDAFAESSGAAEARLPRAVMLDRATRRPFYFNRHTPLTLEQFNTSFTSEDFDIPEHQLLEISGSEKITLSARDAASRISEKTAFLHGKPHPSRPISRHSKLYSRNTLRRSSSQAWTVALAHETKQSTYNERREKTALGFLEETFVDEGSEAYSTYYPDAEILQTFDDFVTSQPQVLQTATQPFDPSPLLSVEQFSQSFHKLDVGDARSEKLTPQKLTQQNLRSNDVALQNSLPPVSANEPQLNDRISPESVHSSGSTIPDSLSKLYESMTVQFAPSDASTGHLSTSWTSSLDISSNSPYDSPQARDPKCVTAEADVWRASVHRAVANGAPFLKVAKELGAVGLGNLYRPSLDTPEVPSPKVVRSVQLPDPFTEVLDVMIESDDTEMHDIGSTLGGDEVITVMKIRESADTPPAGGNFYLGAKSYKNVSRIQNWMSDLTDGEPTNRG